MNATALGKRARRKPVPWDQIVLHVILIIFAFLAVLPLVWCIFASFKSFKELLTSTDLLPHVVDAACLSDASLACRTCGPAFATP